MRNIMKIDNQGHHLINDMNVAGYQPSSGIKETYIWTLLVTFFLKSVICETGLHTRDHYRNYDFLSLKYDTETQNFGISRFSL